VAIYWLPAASSASFAVAIELPLAQGCGLMMPLRAIYAAGMYSSSFSTTSSKSSGFPKGDKG